eukprot:gnl/MRDRNA2_/MRDRNA2_90755_c0_seq1.p1 gnl/MRDRNA2_/MRDRNA2_90755_c0~~gnl/MRDRNA2_/MRDRNA2_90755_c0_seq1.p1  ORF type:complete len:607 (+),score=110.64 gnl/MRDRNA2_/MRDRNA2_90755_c0_seq1:162-1823(+)
MGPPPIDPNVATVHRESYKIPGLQGGKDPEQDARNNWLRGHHFDFGWHAGTGESNMKATFKHPGGPLAETSGNEDMRPAKLEDFQQANFTLGSDKNPEQYVSVHTAEISAPAKIKPLPPSKIDGAQFRQHHVVLGSDKPHYSTHTEETYVDHGGASMTSVQERDAKRQQMRLASFSFGSHSPTYTSTCRDSYNEQPIHKDLCAGQTPRVVLERVNYTLGCDYQPRRSEAKDAFGNEQALRDQCANRQVPHGSKDKKELNSAHFALGHDKMDYGTVGHESYTTPKIAKGEEVMSARESAARLRRSNVTLGCDSVPKVTSARTAYQPPPADCEAFHPMTDRRKGYLDGVHFEHGHDTAELRAERSKPFSHHTAQAGLRNANYSQLTGLRDEPHLKEHLQKSSVLMGNMPSTGETTHCAGYKEYPGFQRAFVSDEHRRALRQAHFSFGNDDVFNKDLCTVHRECFSEQKPSVHPHESLAYSMHGKANNVLLGVHGVDYGTEHKGAYVDPVVASPPPKKTKPVYHGHEDVTSEKQQQFRWPERPRLSAAGQSVVVRP